MKSIDKIKATFVVKFKKRPQDKSNNIDRLFYDNYKDVQKGVKFYMKENPNNYKFFNVILTVRDANTDKILKESLIFRNY